MKLARHIVLVTALVLSAGAAAQTEAPSGEIVVTGYGDIVVNGRAIRCREAPGDRLDNVSVPGWHEYIMIVPGDRGDFVARRANEWITGPEFWQRVGFNMGEYRFRAPSADQPMCIGGRGSSSRYAHGGFRRVVDATAYRGHRLRFTAWVATRDADQVSFWLAAGPLLEGGQLLNGGNTNNVRFGGDHGWTRVLLETGPIVEKARHVSYGFNLQGSGDVWVSEPRLEMVVDPVESARTTDRIEIGVDQG